MMAEHPEEAAIITRSAGAVMLNMGNLTDVRKESMIISAGEAVRSGKRFLLDVCGSACLPTRREYALSLMGEAVPGVIKGNYSEIFALCRKDYTSSGVDADKSLGPEALDEAAVELALKYGTTVLASGRTDIITDGKTLYHVENGTAMLGTVTGTGCMQGALCSAFLSVADGLKAALSGAVMFGICGELAKTDKGSGTFAVNLMDSLSAITDENIENMARVTTKLV